MAPAPSLPHGHVNLLALALIAAIGVSIGAVGIGGFLVVPVLVFVEGRTLREAVIAASVAFAGAGLVSLFAGLRERRVDTGSARSFLVASAPGALIGALLLRVIDATAIGILITVAVGLAGVAELSGWPRVARSQRRPLRGYLDGAMTGLASALTGTSGPMIAMPLLAWNGTPIRERIRIGRIAQLPIALTAAAVFVAGGDIAWTLAGISAIALGVGVLGGMRLTPRVSPIVLSRTAAALMLATACSMLATVIVRS